MAEKKKTILCFQKMKDRGEKIVALTAYDYPSARILDRAGVDLILVGDSAANVVLGYDSTLPVSMDEMLMLSSAVVRGCHRALVVSDMPFLSYQISPEQALENAGRFIRESGAGAVKLEGGRRSVPAISKIVETGIPVMGHLGLTPQSYLQMGGYRIQGKESREAELLVEEALALEEAGIFALVLEGIPWTLARHISGKLRIPTIGIGAGAETDGQVLVLHDMLGLEAGDLKFVKRYADLGKDLQKAVEDYAREVRQGQFPAEEHRFEAPSAHRAAGEDSS
ncbi:MAG: 3-methyl-2-oxobutanoate hydroxymethyltransferase [Candidatus Krumholzibacteria bacterium]|nr:3-methyl-2-oxobutanoate hydroxymethyltransferase [Candidatus Krumholzibacteria bacterium]MDP6669219.1 3-methyl-2-oxobutanoate hydroxymethyltransferase [Candidatus Krumholzibacteria bacterium]MDP6796462.1 3-methyl-2-oxobutanoate hydroxymethyltransferase [Candidatus Krumholzibacteria bacterium]MDP7021592.1 3-methyl-2-oxobutanoate hydroxymethyltransferase [Candidatus Krumholzibacteria bacterium]